MAWVTLTEFAKNRRVKDTSIAQYVRRHRTRDEFSDDHVKVIDKMTCFDEVAVNALERRYKPAEPVSVITETETLRELNNAFKRLTEVQNRLSAVQAQLLDTTRQLDAERNSKALLEQKEYSQGELISSLRSEIESIRESKKQAEEIAAQAAGSAAEAMRKATEAQKGLEQKQKDLEQAQQEIERLRNRTFWKRILNK